MTDLSPSRTHCILRDGHRLTWQVPRLWALAEGLPDFDCPLDLFAELFDLDVWFGDRHPPTVGRVLDHMARVQAADLSHPVLLSADDIVMDGVHRICRARLLGHTSIRAVRFVPTPEPDLREPWG
jgi:hypothetical protein